MATALPLERPFVVRLETTERICNIAADTLATTDAFWETPGMREFKRPYVQIILPTMCRQSLAALATIPAIRSSFATLVLLCAACWTTVAPAEEIRWLRSAEQAATLAAQSGKPILVYVRSANCHYCDLMQSNVWQDPTAVAAVNRDFVPLKLTREENPEAVQALQIKGFPSTVIFAADRRYVDRLDGYVEPEKFLKAVGRAKQASVR